MLLFARSAPAVVPSAVMSSALSPVLARLLLLIEVERSLLIRARDAQVIIAACLGGRAASSAHFADRASAYTDDLLIILEDRRLRLLHVNWPRRLRRIVIEKIEGEERVRWLLREAVCTTII